MQRVKVPASLTVLGRPIVVEWKTLKNENAYYEHDLAKITIDDQIRPEILWPTLLHELIHAYLNITGISEVMSEQLEEAICRAIENLSELVELKKIKA